MDTNATELIEALRKLPHPSPLLAEMLSQGHFEIRSVSYHDDTDLFYYGGQLYRPPSYEERNITIEIKQFINTVRQPATQPDGARRDFDFESTAEEIVVDELPRPRRKLPRGKR